MQTFLPYSSFSQSAACLDPKRLNKQIVECQQIYKALTLPAYGWKNHPAVKMWKGKEYALLLYGLAMYLQWQYKNDGREHKSGEFLVTAVERFWDDEASYPFWLGYDAFHASHRAALLYKLPEWYSQFGWTETPAIPDEKGRLPYFWPKGKE
jgi:hypothetical protein